MARRREKRRNTLRRKAIDSWWELDKAIDKACGEEWCMVRDEMSDIWFAFDAQSEAENFIKRWGGKPGRISRKP